MPVAAVRRGRRASASRCPYVNLYPVNGAVIVPTTGHPADADVLELIGRVLPRPRGRRRPRRGARVRRRRRALHHPAGPRMSDADPRCITRRRHGPGLAGAGRAADAGRRGASALVQHRWHPDPAEHRAALAEGVRMAAGEGARLVCLQELTLSPYFAITPDGPGAAGAAPEPLPGGPTYEFAAELAAETGCAGARVALRAGRTTAGSGSTPRSASRPTARCWPAPARRTSR